MLMGGIPTINFTGCLWHCYTHIISPNFFEGFFSQIQVPNVKGNRINRPSLVIGVLQELQETLQGERQKLLDAHEKMKTFQQEAGGAHTEFPKPNLRRQVGDFKA